MQVDTNKIATTGRDGTLILWDIDRRQAIGQPFTLAAGDWGLFIAVDDTSDVVYTFYRDGAIATWELSLDEWMAHACYLINVATLPADMQNDANMDACLN